MAEEKPLYQDDRIKIDYYDRSPEDHLLFIKDQQGKEARYIIPRGILKDIALCDRRRQTVMTFNPSMAVAIQESGIEGRIYSAIGLAYREEQRRIDEYVKEHRAKD